jgi:hypothetical protein
MRKLRFNIASLLGVILVLGVSFAALRESSDVWESGVFTATLGILSVAIVLAIYRSGFRRAFWLGFALFGSIYLALSLLPPIEARLMTSKALAYLDSKIPGRSLGTFTIQFTPKAVAPGNQVQNLAFSLQGNTVANSSGGAVALWDLTTAKLRGGWAGTTENFVRIGHSLLALLIGWLGGKLCRRLHQPSTQTEAPMPSQA